MRENAAYYFTYTSNLLFYDREFFPARLAHLWSLAVEEQFYIIWPWLILLSPRKVVPYLICFFIIAGVSTNYIIAEKGWWVQIFTPACFDAFAIGALLVYACLYRNDIISWLRPNFKWTAILFLLVFFADQYGYGVLPMRTIHSLLAASVIYYVLFRKNIGLFNYFLNNKWLIRLGRISYGVYLYHLFVPELWDSVIKYFNKRGIDLLFNKQLHGYYSTAWLLMQYFVVLLCICLLSWYCIEKPISKFKDKFGKKKSGGLAPA
ncbi:MAG TPA: acyltransferase, partial [Ferruginibacter sp.]|nr:acyltransferase [Ferruginibacter sp.]